MPDIIELPKSVVQIVTGADLGFLILLELPLLIVAYFTVAAVFWRRAPSTAAQVSNVAAS